MLRDEKERADRAKARNRCERQKRGEGCIRSESGQGPDTTKKRTIGIVSKLLVRRQGKKDKEPQLRAEQIFSVVRHCAVDLRLFSFSSKELL